jgi:DNA (cytosine-5)-methyltransferase 1
MKVLDLFSGIGGFSIGLEKVGFETVAFCEIEPFCQAVIRKHWPDTPIYDDVRSLTAEQLRADGLVPNVIVGGYPCQPFSVAGVRRGAEDDRHLWPEVCRLVADIRPAWCIFENVVGHVSMGLDEVLSDLEGEDYAARPFIIPACGVDAPHRRDRVWVIAKNVGDTKRSRQSRDARRRSGQKSKNGRKDVADSESNGLQGGAKTRRTKKDWTKSNDQQSERCSSAYQPLKDRPTLWKPEPNVGRVAYGVSARSHRIKALGNAVVPQIPEMIGRAIVEAEGGL